MIGAGVTPEATAALNHQYACTEGSCKERFKTRQGLRLHKESWCTGGAVARSKLNSVTARDVEKRRRQAAAEEAITALGPQKVGDDEVKVKALVRYLGDLLAGDGAWEQGLERRLILANARLDDA